MNNFGVIEVASTRKANAPGWTYVPDTSIHPAALSVKTQPSNRKRGRNQPNVSLSDLSARQEAKIRKELEFLDRDTHRDAQIAIPAKSGGGASRGANKHTPNVRKILASQKTFANHLDDFDALQPQQQPSSTSHHDTPMPDADADASSAGTDAPQPLTPLATLLRPSTLLAALPPTDDAAAAADPLLASRVPPVPDDAELRALVAAPPLTYAAARAGWDARYPVRVFCEVCGYWGRVKCMRCGARVCALECLEGHRQECVTRYGV